MKSVLIIDPATKKAELDSFNHIVSLSPFPVTYHLPALMGLDSLLNSKQTIHPQAIIIMGSTVSVHDQINWQKHLKHYLEGKIAEKVPILGLCYGHQLLAHIFKAQVRAHPSGKKQVGQRSLDLSEDSIFGKKNKTYQLIVSHKEIVSTVPAEMQLIARSREVEIEALAHKKLPIFSWQGHLEATSLFSPIQKNKISLSKNLFDDGKTLFKNFFSWLRVYKKT